jgi:hypothetical protein
MPAKAKRVLHLFMNGGASHVDTFDPKPSLANGVPTIYTSQAPTELIVFKGEPDFVPIVGTQLLWASNTTSDVLIDTSNSIRDRFKFEQEAAIEFLSQIIRPKFDRGFIIGFDTTPENAYGTVGVATMAPYNLPPQEAAMFAAAQRLGRGR